MLEIATIRDPGLYEDARDLGRILDTMLYYSSVHLIIDETLFRGIWVQVGMKSFDRLLAMDGVTSMVSNEMVAAGLAVGTPELIYNPSFMTQTGTADGRKVENGDIVGSLHLNISTLFNEVTRSDVSSLLRNSNKDTLVNRLGGYPKMRSSILSLVADVATMKGAITASSKRSMALETPAFDRLELAWDDRGADGAAIMTNLPPAVMRAIDWGAAFEILQAFSIDLFLSDSHSGDLISAPRSAEFTRWRLDESLRRAANTKEKLDAFVNVAARSSRSLGDAFNTGQLTFDECLDVIDSTRKFREWLQGVPADADLIKEYIAAISKDTVLGKLPAKVGRWALFAAGGWGLETLVGGGAGYAASLGLSIADTFILDHIAGGWRPNVFFDLLAETIPEDPAD